MDETITKPDINPIIVVLLNVFLFGGVGYLYMGQKKKGIVNIVMTLALIPLSICTLSLYWWFFIVFHWSCVYDAYLLAKKLQEGGTIGVEENAVNWIGLVHRGGRTE